MNIKKLLCIFEICALLVLCACGKTTIGDGNTQPMTPDSGTGTVDTLSLLYSASDSLNPYKAETKLNRQIASLMFDPLVRLDSTFQPQYILAESIELNGKECILTLKNAVFSDGSPVTADDVVYSVKLAKESDLIYKEQLATVSSCTADGTDKIKFTLTKADPYFANLCDFPIIKSGSDDRKDENKISLPPIGSGRFVFDVDTKTLKANASCVTGVSAVSTINLMNAPDSEVIKYNLEAGNVDIYYTDLADASIPPMSGTAVKVELNNLVYLGLNLSNKYLSKPEVRYALAAAIDRTAVCNDAYYSYAGPAKGLFNSVWSDAGNLQNLSSTSNLENVVANLSEIGYNNKNQEGYFTDSGGKPLNFKLITYSGNERRLKASKLIAEQLEAAGFSIKTVSLEWDEYVAALSSGDFDIYIAEVKLMNNMDVTELVTSEGSLSYGIPALKPSVSESTKPESTDSEESDSASDDSTGGTENAVTSYVPLLDAAVSGFYNEQLSLVDIINAFNAEMPIIPICHRCGLTVCSPALAVTSMSSVSDLIFGSTDINKAK